jgi:hypothetical protein
VGEVAVTAAVNTFNTPGTVAAGGVAFDALSGGTTTVRATAPGFDATRAESSVVATVSQPGITVSSGAAFNRLGSGLQTQGSVTLGGSQHGGVTVRIASANPDVLRIAPNATTAGTAFIDVTIPNGSTQASLFVQGVRGATGNDITVTASSAQFTDGTVDVDVIAPVLRVAGLNPNTNTLAADDPFFVDFWNTRPDTGGIQQQQAVSAEGPLAVTFTSSNPAVGALTTLTETAVGEVTVTAAVTTFNTPTTVAAGGVAFDALSGGTTTVRATAPGFDATRAESSVVVTVSP